MRIFGRALGLFAILFLAITTTSRDIDESALAPARDRVVQLVFLDVGQADATIIRSPEGKTLVIDGGRVDLPDRVRALGIDTVDLVVATHAHSDHIEGIDDLLAEVPVRFYLDNGLPHTTGDYRRVMDALEQSEVTYLRPEARTLELGSVTLRVFPPPGGDDQNDNSVGILVEYGDFTALFTGDSETGQLDYLVGRGVPDVTLLKAAHHGSENGVTAAWLAATKPNVVVISAGRDNRYGHPHASALDAYMSATDEIYRTDRDGDVIVRGFVDGTFDVLTRRDVRDARRDDQ